MSNVSVIMVSYYTGPTLWLAIDSVLAQAECKELLLVDNGNLASDARRLENLAQKEPRIKIISGQGNVGFAKACNVGARKANGDYILLLNPDSVLPAGGLTRALAAITKFPEKTLAGCYLINPNGSEQRGGRRAIFNPFNAITESLGLQRFFKNSQRLNFHETQMPESAHEVPAISGAFMLLPRAFYNTLGGLDEGYFLHMEDMDFCARVRKAGGTIICMPEVKVIHFRSTSEVPSGFIEKHKAIGFIRYLNTHYKDQHSSLFLTVMTAGIWLRYALKVCVNAVNRVFEPPLAGKQEIARLALLYSTSKAKDTSLAGRIILVTGASGQVGLGVVGYALARGAKVLATYHTTRIAFVHPNLEWIRADLADKEVAYSHIKADTLIHTAALWMLPDILPKLYDAGVKRVIAFGSTSVLGKADSKNAYEKQVVEKLETAEKESLRISNERSKPITILRPTMIYGVGLDANLTRMADVIRRFGFLPIYMPAEGLRHPVQALDLAHAALTLVDNASTYAKAYNLGGPEAITYHSMVERIFAYLGKKPKLIPLPLLPVILDALGKIYQFSNINGEIAHRMNRDLVFDIQPAKDDFGYAPHAFLEGEVTL